MVSQFGLLKSRLFLPLFLTQFLGAWNDNLMKSTFVVLVAYGQWDTSGMKPEVLVSLAAALFILPFILFTPFAGVLTDRWDKSKIIRMVKLAEIAIVIAAIAALYAGSTFWAFLLLFIMGAQSAFFAPGKLALLPQHLKEDSLIGANALISTSTYIAILLATLIATVLALQEWGCAILSCLMIISALAGYTASRFIPPAPPDIMVDSLKHSWNPFIAIRNSFVFILRAGHGILWVMLAISWFYFVAGVLHSQFPNYAKISLGVDTNVLGLFMALFSIGVGIGGLLNNYLLKGVISARFVPWASLGIVLFSADLYFSTASFIVVNPTDGQNLLDLNSFLVTIEGWRIIADLFFLSIAGGLYVIPLRAIVQIRASAEHRARVISVNTLTDAMFLLLASLISALLLSIGFEVIELFYMLAIATFIVALILFRFKPVVKGI